MQENSPRTIMVVDDELEVLKHVGRILERSGYEVLLASKGKEALALASKKTPDLIFLDIIMADMDGGDVAAKLSENPATANVPIVFLTGVLSKDEAVDVKKSGQRYVMAKPVTPKDILDMIEKILNSGK